jgi:hypothetical protein
MKSILLIAVWAAIALFPAEAFAQKAKDISKYKVKSVSYIITQNVEGKELTYKESSIVFDAKGNPVEESFYDKNGKLKKKETYVYNKNNKIVEHVIFDGNGNIKKKELTKYNSNNDKIEELTLNGSGKELKKVVIKYNGQGDKTEELLTNEKGITKTVFEYDKNGMKREKKVFDGSGNLILTKKYDYQYQ